MSTLVRNERDKDYHFVDDKRRKRTLPPGQVAVITDSELDQVPIPLRGPGGIHVLHPTEASSDANRTLLDYYDPGGGTSEIRYMGMGQQGDAVDQPIWTIKRFTHDQIGAEWLVTDIQVLNNVRWDERATLGWT